MINPINSLMNMEMALYGGSGLSTTAPSFYNNYMGGSFGNSYQNAYGYYNNAVNYNNNLAFRGNQGYDATSFGQNIPQGYSNQGGGQQSQGTIFGALNQKQGEAIVDFYAKNLEPTQSFANAAISGTLMGAAMCNPRSVFHPINFVTSVGEVKEMFKDVKKEGTVLNKLWKENKVVMEEAYAQMHRATSRSKSKIGMFRKRYSAKEYQQLKGIMDSALKTGNIDEIAKATATLEHAYCNNGWFFRGWNKVKSLFGKSNLATVEKGLAKTDEIAKRTTELLSHNKMTIPKAFKKAGGWVGIAFGAIEILLNLNKIKTAKQRDAENAQRGQRTNYGAKQTKQTVLKAVSNSVGWMVGETLSIWAYAKLGASVGTAISPGLGSLIGAAIGMLGGSLGMWAAGKLINKPLIGDDVANKIEAQNMARTQEGQQELLKYTMEQAQKGKINDPTVNQALGQLLNSYA